MSSSDKDAQASLRQCVIFDGGERDHCSCEAEAILKLRGNERIELIVEGERSESTYASSASSVGEVY